MALCGSPGLMRRPLGRGARRRLGQHLVDLLERETLGLSDHDVREERGEDSSRAPDEEHLAAKVGLVGRHEVRGDDGDDAVPEPIGRLSIT